MHRKHREAVLCLDFSPCGVLVVSGDSKGRLISMEIETPSGDQSIHTILALEVGITSVRFSPCGKWLACGDMNGEIYILDDRNDLVSQFDPHSAAVTALDFHPVSKISWDNANKSGFLL